MNAHTDTQAGRNAFRALMAFIGEVSATTCDPDRPGDSRDYRLMAHAIQDSVTQDITRASPAHREAFLAELAYLLCCAADGCLPSASRLDGTAPNTPSEV